MPLTFSAGAPLLVLILWVSGPAAAHARSIFVAPQGNDATGSGDLGRPYRTLIHALGEARDGDVVEVRAGTYREAGEIRFRNPGITLRAHAGEAVLLAAPLDAEDSHSSCVWIDSDADRTTLSGLEITGGYYYGISLETKWDWGDPTDRSGACQVVIQDCRIHDTGRDGIKIKPNCDDVTIRRCEIFRTGVGPSNLVDPNAEGIDCVNGDRVRVQDCYLHDIFSTGIYLKGGSTDAVVERCRVTRCGEGGILLGFDTSPEYFDLVANPRYYENIRGTVRDCVIRETGWEGIGMYAAQQPRFLNNTLIDVCRDRIHAAIYFGLSYQDWEPQAGRPPTTQPVVRGNLVVQPSSFDDEMVEIRYSDDLGGMSALAGRPDMDGNGFYIHGSGHVRFTDARPGAAFEGVEVGAWRERMGSDRSSRVNDPATLAQYALCRVPDQGPPPASIRREQGISRLGLTLTRDPSRSDVSIEVQAADRLDGPWTTVATSTKGGAFIGGGVEAEADGELGRKIVVIRDGHGFPGADQRYLQLRVAR